jgi:hypothetical protein
MTRDTGSTPLPHTDSLRMRGVHTLPLYTSMGQSKNTASWVIETCDASDDELSALATRRRWPCR